MGIRPIHEPLLASPILITFENGASGSGFMLALGENRIIITAKHVLFNEGDELRQPRCRTIHQTIVELDDNTRIFAIEFNADNVHRSPADDIAIIDLGVGEDGFMKLKDGVTIEQNSDIGTSALMPKHIAQIEDIFVGNQAYVFGYPTSIGLRRLPQYDFTKPLIRKGIISGIDRTKENIIIDCPVFYGNSGGPVIVAEIIEDGEGDLEYKVMGMVSQFIPYEEKWQNVQSKLQHVYHHNSGYSVVISMNKILRFAKSVGY